MQPGDITELLLISCSYPASNTEKKQLVAMMLRCLFSQLLMLSRCWTHWQQRSCRRVRCASASLLLSSDWAHSPTHSQA
jgi:hypothetical protein